MSGFSGYCKHNHKSTFVCACTHTHTLSHLWGLIDRSHLGSDPQRHLTLQGNVPAIEVADALLARGTPTLNEPVHYLAIFKHDIVNMAVGLRVGWVWRRGGGGEKHMQCVYGEGESVCFHCYNKHSSLVRHSPHHWRPWQGLQMYPQVYYMKVLSPTITYTVCCVHVCMCWCACACVYVCMCWCACDPLVLQG